MMMRRLLVIVVLLAAPLAAQQEKTDKPKDTCLSCHLSTLGQQLAEDFQGDIHHERGLTCAGCHGGDPAAEDMMESMDPAKGYLGVPERARIPQLCARCHSDATFMRTYNPSLRTDQLAQYRTSVHGQRLFEKGDTKVAVCTDCHGVHGIRPASSSRSMVHPLNLPATCGECHADSDHMEGYKIPTDQLAAYQASVHWKTLQEGDMSSPTCATCHGNHGAAPPGVASVDRVCGTCHVRQEQMFNESPHQPAWEMLELAACLPCHGNHRIEPTGDHRIGTGDRAFCVNCHVEGDPGWQAAASMHKDLTELDEEIEQARGILGRAERAGMEVGEGRITLSNAHEKLIKARVEVHLFDPGQIESTTGEGDELAREAYRAGQQALDELAFRRKGLGLSLIAIAFVVFSLWLLIRYLERDRPRANQPSNR